MIALSVRATNGGNAGNVENRARLWGAKGGGGRSERKA